MSEVTEVSEVLKSVVGDLYASLAAIEREGRAAASSLSVVAEAGGTPASEQSHFLRRSWPPAVLEAAAARREALLRWTQRASTLLTSAYVMMLVASSPRETDARVGKPDGVVAAIRQARALTVKLQEENKGTPVELGKLADVKKYVADIVKPSFATRSVLHCFGREEYSEGMPLHTLRGGRPALRGVAWLSHMLPGPKALARLVSNVEELEEERRATDLMAARQTGGVRPAREPRAAATTPAAPVLSLLEARNHPSVLLFPRALPDSALPWHVRVMRSGSTTCGVDGNAQLEAAPAALLRQQAVRSVRARLAEAVALRLMQAQTPVMRQLAAVGAINLRVLPSTGHLQLTSVSGGFQVVLTSLRRTKMAHDLKGEDSGAEPLAVVAIHLLTKSPTPGVEHDAEACAVQPPRPLFHSHVAANTFGSQYAQSTLMNATATVMLRLQGTLQQRLYDMAASAKSHEQAAAYPGAALLTAYHFMNSFVSGRLMDALHIQCEHMTKAVPTHVRSHTRMSARSDDTALTSGSAAPPLAVTAVLNAEVAHAGAWAGGRLAVLKVRGLSVAPAKETLTLTALQAASAADATAGGGAAAKPTSMPPTWWALVQALSATFLAARQCTALYNRSIHAFGWMTTGSMQETACLPATKLSLGSSSAELTLTSLATAAACTKYPTRVASVRPENLTCLAAGVPLAGMSRGLAVPHRADTEKLPDALAAALSARRRGAALHSTEIMLLGEDGQALAFCLPSQAETVLWNAHVLQALGMPDASRLHAALPEAMAFATRGRAVMSRAGTAPQADAALAQAGGASLPPSLAAAVTGILDMVTAVSAQGAGSASSDMRVRMLQHLVAVHEHLNKFCARESSASNPADTSAAALAFLPTRLVLAVASVVAPDLVRQLAESALRLLRECEAHPGARRQLTLTCTLTLTPARVSDGACAQDDILAHTFPLSLAWPMDPHLHYQWLHEAGMHVQSMMLQKWMQLAAPLVEVGKAHAMVSVVETPEAGSLYRQAEADTLRACRSAVYEVDEILFIVRSIVSATKPVASATNKLSAPGASNVRSGATWSAGASAAGGPPSLLSMVSRAAGSTTPRGASPLASPAAAELSFPLLHGALFEPNSAAAVANLSRVHALVHSTVGYASRVLGALASPVIASYLVASSIFSAMATVLCKPTSTHSFMQELRTCFTRVLRALRLSSTVERYVTPAAALAHILSPLVCGSIDTQLTPATRSSVGEGACFGVAIGNPGAAELVSHSWLHEIMYGVRLGQKLCAETPTPPAPLSQQPRIIAQQPDAPAPVLPLSWKLLPNVRLQEMEAHGSVEGAGRDPTPDATGWQPLHSFHDAAHLPTHVLAAAVRANDAVLLLTHSVLHSHANLARALGARVLQESRLQPATLADVGVDDARAFAHNAGRDVTARVIQLPIVPGDDRCALRVHVDVTTGQLRFSCVSPHSANSSDDGVADHAPASPLARLRATARLLQAQAQERIRMRVHEVQSRVRAMDAELHAAVATALRTQSSVSASNAPSSKNTGSGGAAPPAARASPTPAPTSSSGAPSRPGAGMNVGVSIPSILPAAMLARIDPLASLLPLGSLDMGADASAGADDAQASLHRLLHFTSIPAALLSSSSTSAASTEGGSASDAASSMPAESRAILHRLPTYAHGSRDAALGAAVGSGKVQVFASSDFHDAKGQRSDRKSAAAATAAASISVPNSISEPLQRKRDTLLLASVSLTLQHEAELLALLASPSSAMLEAQVVPLAQQLMAASASSTALLQCLRGVLGDENLAHRARRLAAAVKAMNLPPPTDVYATARAHLDILQADTWGRSMAAQARCAHATQAALHAKSMAAYAVVAAEETVFAMAALARQWLADTALHAAAACAARSATESQGEWHVAETPRHRFILYPEFSEAVYARRVDATAVDALAGGVMVGQKRSLRQRAATVDDVAGGHTLHPVDVGANEFMPLTRVARSVVVARQPRATAGAVTELYTSTLPVQAQVILDLVRSEDADEEGSPWVPVCHTVLSTRLPPFAALALPAMPVHSAKPGAARGMHGASQTARPLAAPGAVPPTIVSPAMTPTSGVTSVRSGSRFAGADVRPLIHITFAPAAHPAAHHVACSETASMCVPASVRCVDLTTMLVPTASVSASASQSWAVEVGCHRLVWPPALVMRAMLRALGCIAPEAADIVLPEQYTLDAESGVSEVAVPSACEQQGIAMLVEAPLALWQAQSEATMQLVQHAVTPEVGGVAASSTRDAALAAASTLSIAARLTTAIGGMAVALGAACVLVVEPTPASALALAYREWALKQSAAAGVLSSGGTPTAGLASSSQALPLRAVHSACVSLPLASLPAYAQHAPQAGEVARALPTALDAQLHAPLMFFARGTAAHELKRMAEAYRHTTLPNPLLATCTVTAEEATAHQMLPLLRPTEHPVSVLLASVTLAREEGDVGVPSAPNAQRRRVDEVAAQAAPTVTQDIQARALALAARGVDLSRSILSSLRTSAAL